MCRNTMIMLIGLALTGLFVAAAQAQSGCCRVQSGCFDVVQDVDCTAAGGEFSEGRTCNLRSNTCLPPRTRVGRTRDLSFQPRRPRLVRPHGRGFSPIIARTATPSLPTPTPTPAFLGCCQLNSVVPRCAATNLPESCAVASGVFFANARCLDNGLCAAALAPSCGNGLVEVGEECESDIHCNQPVQRCTANCRCVGGVEVWLRWSNFNDLDLTVVDPLGNIYVPPHDANAECNDTVKNPQESVFLPPGEAPAGCYTVRVRYDHQCPQRTFADTHLDIRLNVEGFKWTIHDVPGVIPGETYETRFGVHATCP